MKLLHSLFRTNFYFELFYSNCGEALKSTEMNGKIGTKCVRIIINQRYVKYSIFSGQYILTYGLNTEI